MSWMTEEMQRIRGNKKSAEEGIQDWKISTLGASFTGKTVMISTLYVQYYRGTESGKKIGIEPIDGDLRKTLRDIAIGLKSTPIELPLASTEVKNGKVKFVIQGSQRKLHRTILLQDHPGEGLLEGSVVHHDTIQELEGSDAFMAFLDSSVVMNNDIATASEKLELDILNNVIRNVALDLEQGDFLPISIVLAKADLVDDWEALIEKAQCLFESLSDEISKCVFFFSPTSSVRALDNRDPENYILSPMQVEAPFLFCMAGTVLRNASVIRELTAQNDDELEEAKNRSTSGGLWSWLTKSTSKAIEKRRLNLKGKRLASLEKYDIEIAESSIEILRKIKHTRVMRQGKTYPGLKQVFGIY